MNIIEFKSKKETGRMDKDVEIVPITISLELYNRHIASLVETLLLIDEQLFPTDKVGQTINHKEAA
jgi:hypothetical protein